MMYFVYVLVEAAIVHQAVDPVVPGILNHQADEHATHQIIPMCGDRGWNELTEEVFCWRAGGKIKDGGSRLERKG